MEPRAVSESRAVLVQWMGPSDANVAGFVHGGTVTAAVDRMTFVQPVHVGDLLTLQASVNAVWRTSMEVGVRVQSENPRSGEIKHTNSAYITMVAVDEHGRPVGEVPPLRTETADEQRREREAQVRRANRLAERDQLREERSGQDSLTTS